MASADHERHQDMTGIEMMWRGVGVEGVGVCTTVGENDAEDGWRRLCEHTYSTYSPRCVSLVFGLHLIADGEMQFTGIEALEMQDVHVPIPVSCPSRVKCSSKSTMSPSMHGQFCSPNLIRSPSHL